MPMRCRFFLRSCRMRFAREVVFPVMHEDNALGEFRADLVVEKKVIVELKACERIIAAHEAQLISYLRSSKLEPGLLLNFGPKPERRRIIWTADFTDSTRICSGLTTRDGADSTDPVFVVEQRKTYCHTHMILGVRAGLIRVVFRVNRWSCCCDLAESRMVVATDRLLPPGTASPRISRIARECAPG